MVIYLVIQTVYKLSFIPIAKTMVDSGFDSEEKLSSIIYEKEKEDANKAYESDDEDESSSNNSLEITFRGTKDFSHKDNKLLKQQQAQQQHLQSLKVLKTDSQLNSCKILQRKLELKVERAKKTYNQYQEVENAKKTKSSNLIPINRLQIPGYAENQPLVDYKSNSDENDDDADEMSFFPSTKSKNSNKQLELNTDTFSIQEMTIESDNNSDDSGSQNLELLPPLQNNKFLDKLLNCFYCSCFQHNYDLS